MGICGLLYRLGVTKNYKGFFQTAYAVELCREEPDRLVLVTKLVYPEVAKQAGTSWMAVERNIRTVGGVIWRKNRPLLNELAHVSLSEQPCPAQLLSILAASVDADALTACASGKSAARGRASRVECHVSVDGMEAERVSGKLNSV